MGLEHWQAGTAPPGSQMWQPDAQLGLIHLQQRRGASKAPSKPLSLLPVVTRRWGSLVGMSPLLSPRLWGTLPGDAHHTLAQGGGQDPFPREAEGALLGWHSPSDLAWSRIAAKGAGAQ